MYEREAEEMLLKINDSFKVLLVVGPRQVGKSTLLKKIMPENMNYVTLDDVTLRELAINDPKLFLETYPAPLFIDEAQYAPELFSYIKMIVDDVWENKALYWLSGSRQFELLKSASESLAGRVGIIRMNSFTYQETIGNINSKMLFDPDNIVKSEHIDVNTLFNAIYKGGMPRLFNEEVDRNIFFDSYIETYISKDIMPILSIRDTISFKQFLTSLASRVGSQLNMNALADDAGISFNTAKSWLGIVEKSGLIYLLPSYKNSAIKRLTKMSKIIWMDTGLCAFLCGFESMKALRDDSMSGCFLESYIISDIIKSYNAKCIKPDISYYRDRNGKEIDLILKKNRILYPFEIKKTANPNKEMLSNFYKIEELKQKLGNGGLICLYDKIIPLDEKNKVIPVSSVININK